MIRQDSLFIGGTWTAPHSARTIPVVSASTEEPVGIVPEAIEADVDAAVDAARAAFADPAGWAHWAPAERADALERLAGALEARGPEMARRVSTQNGMPIQISVQLEAVFPPLLLRYYARVAREQ